VGRGLARLLGAAGWALLGALALLGVGISAVVGLAASPVGRPVVAGVVVRQLDAALAGRLELEAVEVLPRGGIEVRGLQVYDPEENLVLQVSRARLFADLTHLSSEEIGVVLELDGPSILLESDPDGGVSLARAFAPAHPSPPTPGRPGSAPARPSWTLRLTRLTVRGGELWWQRADRSTGAEVTGLDLDAEGAYGPAGGFLGLRARGAATSPVAGPLALEVAASLKGDRLEVPVLKGSLGPTALEALGHGDLASGAFRAAVTRLGVGAADARRLAPGAAPGGDLAGTAYAESSGVLATAALDVRPDRAAPPGGAPEVGAARAAVAVQLRPPARAVGFDVALDALDPSRLLAQAPPGRITLTARGGAATAAAGAAGGLADARGRLALEVAPSRLRDGEFGPVSLSARADRGLVEVVRLAGRLPGLTVNGAGRWRDGGGVGGEVGAEADDLARLGRNLTALTGTPLPPLGGRLRAKATLAGTARAPEARVTVEAPLLASGAVRAEAVVLTAEAAGPLATLRARLTASAARAVAGGTEARTLQLAAGLAGDEASLSLSAHLPGLGRDPVVLQGAARLARDRRTAEVRELTLGWPGVRWALTRPATATFDPPGVDRLELADGPRRLALSGGLGQRGALDARLELVRLDLARLPRGLLPPDLGVKGELSLDARASGTTRHPSVAAHLALADGAARGLGGLQLLGDLGWDGKASRLTADLGLVRAEGGAFDLAADVPLPLARAAGSEPLSLTLSASGWALGVLQAAGGGGEDPAGPLSGTLGAHLAVTGTVAAPSAKAAVTLQDGRLEDLGPLGVATALELDGDAALLTAAARLDGATILTLDARLPLDLAGLLLKPEAVVRAVPEAPLTGSIDLPGLELSRLSGKAGLPEGLAGTVSGSASLGGTMAAPRGRATVALAGAAAPGQRDLSGRVELTAEPERTTVQVRAAAGGAEALRLDATLGAPPERLAEPAALRAAPLTLEASVPGLPLRRVSPPGLPLDGTLTAKVALKGTLARPEGRLDAAGAGLAVDGRPLGEVSAVVRYEAPSATAELSLRPATGGVLWAGATLAAALGLDLDGAALRRAPATLRVTSDRLDLGFLPAVAPGVVRAASGPLTVDLSASGPLEGLRPRGTIKLTGGRVAVVELGDWSELALEASLGDQAIEVPRLEARRAKGRLDGRFSLRELGTPKATLEGHLAFDQFTLSRSGMDLVTLDLPVELRGTLTDDQLDATVTIPGGTVRLPKKTPRALQPLDGRGDIQVGRPKPRRPSWLGAAGPGQASARPFEARWRVVLPGRLLIKGESPSVDLEVKGDTSWRVTGGELLAEGPVEVVRGTVEPITGRVFHVERGRVSFTGAGVGAGQLDAAARYDHPLAQVTVTVGGTVSTPTIQLSSRPPMDDAAIAMLIATGRTEIKANTSEVSSLTGKEAGNVALGAAAGMIFKSLVADKLPVDQVSIDASTLRAGKYLTDKLFVGYTRRFEAKPEKGENGNEVKAEYQITPRWNFELRYGDAQAGDASLIWSKDY
jgi:translocation and assembly module TamB